MANSTQLSPLLEHVEQENGTIRSVNAEGVRREIEYLAPVAAFGSLQDRSAAHRLSWEIGRKLGIYPASIDSIYRAVGANVIDRRFTVPAVNMRAVAFHTARGIFQAMAETRAGAVIFELSRGEIGFTAQRPHEYATMILCAAIAEGYSGPVFLQGDHFQVSASGYAENPEREVQAVEALIIEAVSAGFFNIDIDTSTMVNLSSPDIARQQELNVALTARLAKLIRELEPEGVTISVGGEIGEVGEANSTAEEVQVFLSGVTERLLPDHLGLSKLSVQAGTRHGGLVLPDGSFGDMPVDFSLIEHLTRVCRESHGIAGSVLHGASMLQIEKIARLPDADCAEVHLAAAFLNAVYDCLPEATVRTADNWVRKTFSHEWKKDWSEKQFLQHARRYPIGPFKRDWWALEESHGPIREAICQKALAYFEALGVKDTQDLASNYVGHGPVAWHPTTAQQDINYDEVKIGDLSD